MYFISAKLTSYAIFILSECPLMSFTMPKQLYCIFSSDCMAVECCMNVKISMFLRVVKAYASFNPCTFKFRYGFDVFKDEIQLPTIGFDGKICQQYKI